MRIIAGSARGRQIFAPKGQATRPTLDRVKESLFGILQFSLPGARVLDLYAGSGSLGLEALSRGAGYAVFNDHSRECCGIIRKNIDLLGFSDRAAVTQYEALSALERLKGTEPFSIVFLDPPYRAGAQQALTSLFANGLVAEGGQAVVEHAWKEPPIPPEGCTCVDTRKYGDTGLSFFAARTGGKEGPDCR
ncbi:MAG TPA: 16S rRNA (guanine(966)-N(2))-methyltransferase RsmD [Feifaniaceae bacterium]|nr:16S rRNA (guanine(966)-N(2))-methyltransferase RsmD [Feifaniaceae bacterium]